GDNDSIEGPDSIRVFAVGFGTGIDDYCANTLNWAARWGGTCADSSMIAGDTTAVNGSEECCGTKNPRTESLTGYAYIAEDAGDLANALRSIFVEVEASMSQSYTSAEVTSVEEEFLSTEYQSKLYVASFKPDTMPFWDGNLRALKMLPGVLNLDLLPDSVKIWEAGDTIAKTSADSRPIYGIKSDGSMLPFDTSHFTDSDLDVSSANVYSVIDRIRDGNVDDSLGQLGDIFHSSPLRIQSPNYFYEDEGWDSFYNVMSGNRSSIIYAGGNDGMLHVIADTIYGQAGKGGHEIAGIIPMNFVPEVKNLLSYHDYFVDGDPMAADVWFPANNSDSTKEWDEWHTILIATQGEGGNSFTAFDITDPRNETSHTVDSLTFLFDAWQSDTLKNRLGFTTSTPAIYKVGVNWTAYPGRFIDRFYGFMGGGQFPDPMDISIVDSISSGTVKGNNIIAFDVWQAATSGIDGNVRFIPPEGASMNYPFVASPALINIDPQFGNRYDYLFIPDAAGQLWFVNLKFPNPLNWRAWKIFEPELPSSSDSAEIYNWHPAYYYPLVWKDPTYGGYWIAYGTGNRSSIFDEASERFYALHFDVGAFSD
ncbi:MAG: PilC/PilY family type IV pilus protein, partial [candidate division WOR-3 bacterium]